MVTPQFAAANEPPVTETFLAKCVWPNVTRSPETATLPCTSAQLRSQRAPAGTVTLVVTFWPARLLSVQIVEPGAGAASETAGTDTAAAGTKTGMMCLKRIAKAPWLGVATREAGRDNPRVPAEGLTASVSLASARAGSHAMTRMGQRVAMPAVIVQTPAMRDAAC